VQVEIEVERGSEEPVYAQVARQVREHVVAGRLRAGEPLPSVRTLASDLGVNLNTIARAYRQLEEEGFVLIRDREGAQVAAPSPRADATRIGPLREELQSVLARLRQAGAAPDRIARMVKDELGKLGGGCQ
jgi:DNA-binding transcriptional regulator YhcF (GntR family)